MSTASVAIVILNWNGKNFLEQFLPSVLASGYSPCRVVVADNHSTDGSVEFLQQNFPSVEILKLPQNFGFAKGYNEALKQVSADYYVLLNSDVEVTPGWLQPCIQLLQSDSLAAACQPKILSWKEKSRFEYAGAAGGWIDAYGFPFARGRVFDDCEEDHQQYNEISPIFWASGAALVIRAQAFRELNGFDEYLFAHMEEIDLCWRIHLSGQKVFSCPASVVYHVGGGTLPQGNSRKTFLNFRNNLIILGNNLPWREKWWKIPYRIALNKIAALRALLSGDGGFFLAVLKAHLAFIYWGLFGKKASPTAKKRRMQSLPGVYAGNIVWDYFVKNKKTFREIVGDEKKMTDR